MKLLTRLSALLLGASSWCHAVSAADNLPPLGDVDINVVYPFNANYDVFNGSIPIVFGLSRPDLAAILQLDVSYVLYDNTSRYDKNLGTATVFSLNNKSTLPETRLSGNTNGTEMWAFFVHFSNESIAGRQGKFILDISIGFSAEVPGSDHTPDTLILGAGVIFQMPLYIYPGHPNTPPVPGTQVHNASIVSTVCVPAQNQFNHRFTVTDYVTHDDVTYAKVTRDSLDQVKRLCALEVDADTAAVIEAGPDALASSTSAAAKPSSTSSTNAAVGGPVPHSMVTAASIGMLLSILFGGGYLLHLPLSYLGRRGIRLQAFAARLVFDCIFHLAQCISSPSPYAAPCNTNYLVNRTTGVSYANNGWQDASIAELTVSFPATCGNDEYNRYPDGSCVNRLMTDLPQNKSSSPWTATIITRTLDTTIGTKYYFGFKALIGSDEPAANMGTKNHFSCAVTSSSATELTNGWLAFYLGFPEGSNLYLNIGFTATSATTNVKCVLIVDTTIDQTIKSFYLEASC
ncbi:hypothetical protein SBRCBS47491_002210 [Sporothrix bragantina]|uniref:DUF7136 domain-containing protein n=1 Tax=Sporothrix bragantina TaxID=671064 RepID=A0ABP0B533_9PEZI